MELTIIGCVLFVLSILGAGAFSTLADKSSEGKLFTRNISGSAWKLMPKSTEGRDRFMWWNKDYSWNNKNTAGNWLYVKIGGGKKFFKWLMRNPLVFLTDGWHLMNWCCNRCWQAAPAILSPYPVFTYFFVWVMFSGAKEMTRRL